MCEFIDPLDCGGTGRDIGGPFGWNALLGGPPTGGADGKGLGIWGPAAGVKLFAGLETGGGENVETGCAKVFPGREIGGAPTGGAKLETGGFKIGGKPDEGGFGRGAEANEETGGGENGAGWDLGIGGGPDTGGGPIGDGVTGGRIPVGGA